MRRTESQGRLGWRAAIALGLCVLAGAASARAEIGSDKSAAVVIFPKILVDTSTGLDTFIRISNTSDTPILLQCFYVNATPQCSVPGGTCFPDPLDCVATFDDTTVFGRCEPQWQETDFFVRLTAFQPTGWLASQGSNVCPAPQLLRGVCSNDPNIDDCQVDSDCGSGNRCVYPPCFPLDGIFREGPDEQNNQPSNVPDSPEDPFIGELKCIALDDSGQPIGRNDLKGEALIGIADEASGFIDIAGYNAVGIPGIPGQGDRDNVLVLGGAGDGSNPSDPCHDTRTCPEYEGCPNFLILDHIFDGAVDPLVSNVCRDDLCTISGDACTIDADCPEGGVRVATDLTLIPCTQDLLNQDPDLSATIAQFLVYNEFEQRFSTSRPINCFKEVRLSNIDTIDNDRSIFSAGVAGSLTGQTKIRGVENPDAERTGNTLLGVAEEFRCRGGGFPLCSFTQADDLVSTTAANLHFDGRRPQSDFLFLP